MNFRVTLLITIALMAGCWISFTNGACNVCNRASSAACINSTAYNLCSGDVLTGIIMDCPIGFYCTRMGMKCINDANFIDCADDNQAVDGCGCSKNRVNDVIACTSRNTFVLCDDGVATEETGTCPNGYVCNSGPSSKKICVSESCALPTCERDANA